MKYYDIFHSLHSRIDDLTYGDDGGLEFQFWQVPRKLNVDADRLVNQVLDRQEAGSENE